MSTVLFKRYLRPFGLEDYVDEYSAYGGYILGLELALRYGEIILPDDFRLILDDARRLDDNALHELVTFFPEGFGVKYSGYREAFSPWAARGAQSSRGRFWSGGSPDKAVRLLQQAIANTPPGGRAIVVQSYVKPPAITGVIYVHAYEHRVLAEFSGNGYRQMAELTSKGVARYTLPVSHARSGGDQTPRLDNILSKISRLRLRLGFDIDVECFARESSLIVTQLRPIPQNVDATHVKGVGARICRILSNNTAEWYLTPWVYGIWSYATPFILDKEEPGRPAVLAKRTADIRECKAILARLARKESTLVLDCVDGFHLTHYPDRLPGKVDMRESFSYVSVAGTSLAQLESGQQITILSNGDFAIVRSGKGYIR